MFSFVPELPLPPPPLFEQLVPKRQFKRPSKAETKRNARSDKKWIIIQNIGWNKGRNTCILGHVWTSTFSHDHWYLTPTLLRGAGGINWALPEIKPFFLQDTDTDIWLRLYSYIWPFKPLVNNTRVFRNVQGLFFNWNSKCQSVSGIPTRSKIQAPPCFQPRELLNYHLSPRCAARLSRSSQWTTSCQNWPF